MQGNTQANQAARFEERAVGLLLSLHTGKCHGSKAETRFIASAISDSLSP